MAYIFALSALVCVGCAAGPSRDATAQAYREMREAEAQLERSDARRRVATGDETRAAHEDALCESAARICELSRELKEADARRRCQAAARRCEQTGGRVEEP